MVEQLFLLPGAAAAAAEKQKGRGLLVKTPKFPYLLQISQYMKFTALSLSLIFLILADFPYFGETTPTQIHTQIYPGNNLFISIDHALPYPWFTAPPRPPPCTIPPQQYPLLHPPLIPAPVFFSGFASLKIYHDQILGIFFYIGIGEN